LWILMQREMNGLQFLFGFDFISHSILRLIWCTNFARYAQRTKTMRRSRSWLFWLSIRSITTLYPCTRSKKTLSNRAMIWYVFLSCTCQISSLILRFVIICLFLAIERSDTPEELREGIAEGLQRLRGLLS
jgi:hypothetical protein